MDDYSNYRFDLYALSIILEEATGYDSIRTIRQNYSKNESGSFKCPFPGCRVAHRDARRMWRHIHFTRDAHGYAFNIPWIKIMGLIDE